jgi:hypothetical protein
LYSSFNSLLKVTMSTKLFVIIAALTLPVAAAYGAVQIFEGGWPDGNKIEWVCPAKTSGQIPFRITTPIGTVYRGVLVCGESV